jgi:hypothetical protein
MPTGEAMCLKKCDVFPLVLLMACSFAVGRSNSAFVTHWARNPNDIDRRRRLLAIFGHDHDPAMVSENG